MPSAMVVLFRRVGSGRVRRGWSRVGAGPSARTSPIAVTIRASEIAPGSGVPTLRSASGRARPIFGTSDGGRLRRLGRDLRRVAPGLRRRARRRSTAPTRASTKGNSASSIVLSPSSAWLNSLSRGRRRLDGVREGLVRDRVGVAELLADAVEQQAPQDAAGAAGLVAEGRPGRGEHGLDPAARRGRASAASAAALAPRDMPMPWSPSPATASIRPSSSLCSSTVALRAATARRATSAAARDSSLASGHRPVCMRLAR